MRQRPRIRPLLLLLLIGVVVFSVVFPWTPEAAAGPERAHWAARIAEMDQALGRGDARAAAASWRDAYVAAHLTHTWPGMIAVGDAAVRAGQATGSPQIFAPRARRAYLTALLRARRQASHEGVLAAAEAFGRLGDREAERLARSDAAAIAVRADARRRARAY